MIENTGMKITYTKKGMTVEHQTGLKTIETKEAIQKFLEHLLWLKAHLNGQIKEAQQHLTNVEAAKDNG